MNATITRAAVAGAYLSTIVGANLAVAYLPPVAVAPGIIAPAGVLFAGLALSLRDAVHELGGWRWVAGAIVAGIALAAVTAGPGLALASAVAFGLAETADALVYAPLRKRGRTLAALALSNAVGLVLDTLVFLPIAFGSLAYAPGQIIGKTWVTLATLAVVAAGRAAWKRAAA